MNEKYSILMSVYKKENPDFLVKSIESMLCQTYQADEFIIIKDGPLTKELDDVLTKYKHENPNLINLIPLEKNVGLGRALNIGIKHCKNELVARMDSDDISLPERCEKQVRGFKEDPNLSIIGSMIDEFYDNPENVVSSRLVPADYEDILAFSKRRNPFNHPTIMYKKSDVIKCGGYANLPGAEDFELFLKMLRANYKARNINESLLLYRANENNFSRRKGWAYCQSHINVIYNSWKNGHSSLLDLLLVIGIRVVVFISPASFLKKFSTSYLRKTK